MSLTMALPAAQVTPSSSAPASSGQSQGTGGAGNASAANGAASSASSNSNNTSNPAPASDTTGSAQAANAAAAGQAGSTGAAAPEPGMFAQMLGLQMANLGASATTGSANGAAGTSGAGAKSTGKTLNQAGALLDPAQLTSALLAALQQSTGTQTADASKGGRRQTVRSVACQAPRPQRRRWARRPRTRWPRSWMRMMMSWRGPRGNVARACKICRRRGRFSRHYCRRRLGNKLPRAPRRSRPGRLARRRRHLIMTS